MKFYNTLFVILFITILSGCTNSIKKEPKKTIKSTPINKKQKLITCFVVGDFDGDKKQDTLSEIHTSENQKYTIKEIPFINDFDSTIWYYSKHDIQTSLKSSNKNIKELDLGWSFGTYCLINIGDNNNDQKDEIALVIDYCDWSLLNSCKIYSLCNNEWKLLQSFEVNENAFSYGKNETLDPNKIKDYLEKRNGKWYYMDYLEYFENDSNEEPTLMKPLKVTKCN